MVPGGKPGLMRGNRPCGQIGRRPAARALAVEMQQPVASGAYQLNNARRAGIFVRHWRSAPCCPDYIYMTGYTDKEAGRLVAPSATIGLQRSTLRRWRPGSGRGRVRSSGRSISAARSGSIDPSQIRGIGDFELFPAPWCLGDKNIWPVGDARLFTTEAPRRRIHRIVSRQWLAIAPMPTRR